MTATVHHGDCLNVLPALPAESLHACVTDPTYHLTSNAKRRSSGFMGQGWDGGDVAFRPETWAEVCRVLKPGAHLLAFGGTRTHHRMACAIEDAGFEIRDMIAWLYGTGFPKSVDVAAAVGKAAPRPDDAQAWDGWGTALKPAIEPIIVARRPPAGTVAANVLRHGTGGINIDACRVGSSKNVPRSHSTTPNSIYGSGLGGSRLDGTEAGFDPTIGRWPANVVHDGSADVLQAFPEAPGALRGVGPEFGDRKSVNVYGDWGPRPDMKPRDDGGGSAARFFYCAKADRTDRGGSRHPTIKPVSLMRWLVRLVTPPGGTVLDPFAGTGTTGQACLAEGFDAVLIEQSEEWVADIHARLAHVRGSDTPLFGEAAE